MDLKKTSIIFVVIFLQISVAIIGGVVSAYVSTNRNSVGSEVYIQGVDISNLTEEQARKKIINTLGENLNHRSIVLQDGSTQFIIPFDEVNAQYDVEHAVKAALQVKTDDNFLANAFGTFKTRLNQEDVRNIPLQITFDDQLLFEKLELFQEQIEQPYSDAYLTFEENKIKIVPEIKGTTLDISKTIEAIRENAHEAETIDIIMQDLLPKVTQGDLKGIEEVIGEFTTTIPENHHEFKEDMTAVVSNLNKLIIKPGGQISVLQLLKQKADQPGNGGFATNDGVNQVISTLYNALLLADITVVERTCEDSPVSYIEIGREAVIEPPYIDFIFKNNKTFPILILADITEEEVMVNIFGTTAKNGQIVKIETGEKEVIPKKVIAKTDYTLPKGQKKVSHVGRDGVQVSVYKVYQSEGEEVERTKISVNRYEPEDEIVLIGAKITEDQEGLK